MDTDTEQARWAEAQSIVDRTPTESAEERIRRSRRLTVLLVLAVSAVTGAGAAALAVWLFGNTDALTPSDAVPTWQAIVGFVLSGVALVVMLATVAVQFRNNRRLGVWRSPLYALTRRQRKELLAQVRGQVPIEAARVPLARHLAEMLMNRRPVVVLNLALAVLFTGQWIALRAWWYPAMACFSAVVAVACWLALGRDERRAHRFLAEHPDPGSGA